MKSIVKYPVVIIAVVVGFCVLGWWYADHYPANSHPRIGIDPVMVDGELYFILPEGGKYGVKGIIVSSVNRSSDTTRLVWEMNYTESLPGLSETKEEGEIYPKLKQIKYGQKINGFKKYSVPEKITPGEVYDITLFLTRGRRAEERFHVASSCRVVMPFAFGEQPHPKDYDYTVIIEKNGKEMPIPYSVVVGKDNYKEVVSKSPFRK